jgi:UDP-glucose 4-epimerase
VVFDDLSSGQPEKVSKEAFMAAGSMADFNAVRNICASRRFDTVIHCAAKKAVGESEYNPSLYFETNVVGSFNLLKAMEENRIPQIIFSSTAAVYAPAFETEPVTEETPTGPVSVYGTSKLMIEEMIKNYHRTNKIKKYSILRYFNVAGDYGLNYMERNAQNVFPIIARSAKDNSPFHVFGTDYDTPDGTCVRDYIHLKDLVKAHAMALASTESGTYNLGTGEGYTVRQLIDAFNEQLKSKVNVVESERRPGDPAVVVADASAAKAKLGWHPEHTLHEMVEDTLRVY